MPKKIMITGGSGFFGRNLVEQLSDQYFIEAPSHAELELLDGKKVFEYLQNHNFDVVIHAATWNATATSTVNRDFVLEHNLRMFFNILRGRKYFGKLLYYGSGAEFDRSQWMPKMNEAYFDTHVPVDAYGFSKYVMFQHALNFRQVCNLRAFGVFGKYEDWRIRFLSSSIVRALFGLPITINQNVVFDYIYINDLIGITQWFIENQTCFPDYNICTGKTHDLLSLAKKVLAVSGKDLEIDVAQSGLGREYSGDNSRLINTIGEYRFRSIDDSIAQLYEWYANHIKMIDKSILLSG